MALGVEDVIDGLVSDLPRDATSSLDDGLDSVALEVKEDVLVASGEEDVNSNSPTRMSYDNALISLLSYRGECQLVLLHVFRVLLREALHIITLLLGCEPLGVLGVIEVVCQNEDRSPNHKFLCEDNERIDKLFSGLFVRDRRDRHLRSFLGSVVDFVIGRLLSAKTRLFKVGSCRWTDLCSEANQS